MVVLQVVSLLLGLCVLFGVGRILLAIFRIQRQLDMGHCPFELIGNSLKELQETVQKLEAAINSHEARVIWLEEKERETEKGKANERTKPRRRIGAGFSPGQF